MFALPQMIPPVIDVKLFSGEKSQYLAKRIADYYGDDLGDVTVRRFSDGEMRVIINQSVRGAWVFFIQTSSLT